VTASGFVGREGEDEMEKRRRLRGGGERDGERV